MPSCNICHDLDEYSLVIPWSSLISSTNSSTSTVAISEDHGGDLEISCGGGCLMLRNAVENFVTPLDQVDSLELLVDTSLYVLVRDEKKKRLTTVEFYTHGGRIRPPSPFHPFDSFGSMISTEHPSIFSSFVPPTSTITHLTNQPLYRRTSQISQNRTRS